MTLTSLRDKPKYWRWKHASGIAHFLHFSDKSKPAVQYNCVLWCIQLINRQANKLLARISKIIRSFMRQTFLFYLEKQRTRQSVDKKCGKKPQVNKSIHFF